jgi:hypothetical protein
MPVTLPLFDMLVMIGWSAGNLWSKVSRCRLANIDRRLLLTLRRHQRSANDQRREKAMDPFEDGGMIPFAPIPEPATWIVSSLAALLAMGQLRKRSARLRVN